MSQKQLPEDAFYDNLTLGLIKTLSNVPRICNVSIEKRQPCEKAQVLNWEQRHCVYLPEDMKKFYLSTDGFIFYWSYQYAPNDIRRVGCINFPHLLQITLLRENIEPLYTNQQADALSKDSTMAPNTGPLLTPKSKIFELNSVNDIAKVCLVYETSGMSNPKIYLLELNKLKWQFLSETFSEYLRMAVAHLGLPYWELCFSTCGLPSWTEQLFLLLAPHLLEDNEVRRGRSIQPAAEHPCNILDTNIFRAKPKAAKPPQKTKH
ncbi:tubulin polyglutamylase complex subunit 2 [Eupeodes corollae]|uniref:tubulin polyglutamylase complex subunit 2 n=1 Tax=Eupeodes corollae TaxID=290404 RepID=UPI002493268E|nr:tubulin polyglutamylase complex subunit 2 [Eupeodes corollae]